MHIVMLLSDTLCKTASDCGLPDTSFTSTTLGGLVAVVYQLIAAASVLFLVIGATKYVVSGGDPAGIKNAKTTIIYAILGLVVSLLAFLAVQFLTSKAGAL